MSDSNSVTQPPQRRADTKQHGTPHGPAVVPQPPCQPVPPGPALPDRDGPAPYARPRQCGCRPASRRPEFRLAEAGDLRAESFLRAITEWSRSFARSYFEQPIMISEAGESSARSLRVA